MLGGALRKLGVGFGHRGGMLDVIGEELGEGFHGSFAIADDCRIVVETRMQEFF